MTSSIAKLSALLGAAVFLICSDGAAFGQECSKQLDKIDRALSESDLPAEQREDLQQQLDSARASESDGNEEECVAATADLQSALLQIEGIDKTLLCDRTSSEGDIGEADMAGNQDVQAALQISCDSE